MGRVSLYEDNDKAGHGYLVSSGQRYRAEEEAPQPAREAPKISTLQHLDSSEPRMLVSRIASQQALRIAELEKEVRALEILNSDLKSKLKRSREELADFRGASHKKHSGKFRGSQFRRGKAKGPRASR